MNYHRKLWEKNRQRKRNPVAKKLADAEFRPRRIDKQHNHKLTQRELQELLNDPDN